MSRHFPEASAGKHGFKMFQDVFRCFQSLCNESTLPSERKTLLDLRSAGGDRWNNLWRLCLFLRTAPHGCDAMWIKNPRAPRKRQLNWFQKNTMMLRAAQAKAVESRDRVRAGRLERWIQQGQKLRAGFKAQLEEPDTLAPLILHVYSFVRSLCLNVFEKYLFFDVF